MFEILSYKTSI